VKPARRYIVVIQAPSGYAGRGDPPDERPPEDGPPQPVLHTAVLESDYEAAVAEVERLEGELAALRTRLQAAHDG
jgi:hypothetical protein